MCSEEEFTARFFWKEKLDDHSSSSINFASSLQLFKTTISHSGTSSFSHQSLTHFLCQVHHFHCSPSFPPSLHLTTPSPQPHHHHTLPTPLPTASLTTPSSSPLQTLQLPPSIHRRTICPSTTHPPLIPVPLHIIPPPPPPPPICPAILPPEPPLAPPARNALAFKARG